MSATVLFDGVCNFCNRSVNFIIEHDREGYFMFAPLQSETGLDLLRRYSVDQAADSIVLIEDEQAFTYSTAALRIARRLDGIWKLAYVFIVLPKPLRDWLYRLLAKFRYRLFGKRDECMIPTPELRARFL